MPRLVSNRFRRHECRAAMGAVFETIGARLKRFARESDGFEGIEYSVMAALIVASLVFVLVAMMASVTDTFNIVTTIVRP